ASRSLPSRSNRTGGNDSEESEDGRRIRDDSAGRSPGHGGGSSPLWVHRPPRGEAASLPGVPSSCPGSATSGHSRLPARTSSSRASNSPPRARESEHPAARPSHAPTHDRGGS